MQATTRLKCLGPGVSNFLEFAHLDFAITDKAPCSSVHDHVFYCLLGAVSHGSLQRAPAYWLFIAEVWCNLIADPRDPPTNHSVLPRDTVTYPVYNHNYVIRQPIIQHSQEALSLTQYMIIIML